MKTEEDALLNDDGEPLCENCYPEESRALRASRIAPGDVQAAGSDCGGDGQSMARAGDGDDRLIDPASNGVFRRA